MRGRTIRWGALLYMLAAAPAAAQQRPLVTEDPEVIGAGLVLLEGGFDYSRDILFPASGLQGNLLRALTNVAGRHLLDKRLNPLPELRETALAGGALPLPLRRSR